jgi:Protein of unknown function (DUF3108)
MRKILYAVAILSIACAAQAVELKPMSATYSVTRDGKLQGDSTFTLAANPNGTWTLTSVTKGTSGMARLVNADIREESTFRWKDGKAESLSYNYNQDSSIKHRTRHIDFDAAAKQAHSQENKDRYDYAIPSGTIDRSTLQIVLGAAIASGAHELNVSVAARDRVEDQRYSVNGTEKIDVPAGSFNATRVERMDVPGKGKSWYAANLGMLPVRVEQVSSDNSTIVLELKSR